MISFHSCPEFFLLPSKSHWHAMLCLKSQCLCTRVLRSSFSLTTDRSHWSFLNAKPPNRFWLWQSNFQISTDQLVSFSTLPWILITLHFIRQASHKACCKCVLVWGYISGCPQECALLLNAIFKKAKHCVCVYIIHIRTHFWAILWWIEVRKGVVQ